MSNNTNQLNRRRFLNSTAAVVGATMLAKIAKTDAHAAPIAAPAGTLLIDDFASGTYQPGPLYTGTHKHVVTGSMLGQHRYTNMNIARNARNQPVNIDTGTGYFNFSAGVDAYYRITVGYGYRDDGGTIRTFPLHANLSGCTALRFRFAPVGLLGDLHITMYSPGAHVSFASPHIGENSRTWTYTCPFADFSEERGRFDWADVHQIIFFVQAVGQFALESVEAI
ncbi:hypothetical protein KFU94_33740 [Chloroflexi bacterium TSY]|nr:hypothetical protein [Chloroflexi bacterium TSY]